jgi:ParB-like chromosome segregation protein Spo0J
MKMGDYEVHPAAEIFPMMDDQSYAELREDIRKNGQQKWLVLWQGKLIDGRNRLKACLELGIEPQDSEIPDEADPFDYVLSANLHRRHLTDSQRALVAAKLAKLKAGRPSKEIPPNGGITTSQAAQQLKVPTRTVERAKSVIDKGSSELIEAVEKGSVPVSRAATIAKTVPKEDQIKVATAPRTAPKPAPRPVDKPTPKPEPVAEKPSKPAKAITLTDEQQSEDEQWVLQFVRSRSRAHKLRLLLDELTEAEAHVVQQWYERQISIAD